MSLYFALKLHRYISEVGTLRCTFNRNLRGSLCFIEGKHSQEINDFCSCLLLTILLSHNDPKGPKSFSKRGNWPCKIQSLLTKVLTERVVRYLRIIKWMLKLCYLRIKAATSQFIFYSTQEIDLKLFVFIWKWTI